MYTLDEVLPFIYAEIETDPYMKNNVFGDTEAERVFDEELDDLMHEPGYSRYTLTIPTFTGINDETGEERTFEAKTFTFEVTKSDKIHDSYCEGKAYSHYETYMYDVKTKQKYSLVSEYYETNGDLIGIYVEKLKPAVKKAKNIKTMFVAVKPNPEDYNILGIFQSLDKAITEQEQDGIQIEEVPINCNLEHNEDSDLPNMITGAINVYDLNGNPI